MKPNTGQDTPLPCILGYDVFLMMRLFLNRPNIYFADVFYLSEIGQWLYCTFV